MHENEISEKIIGAAIEVHRFFGPGLVEQMMKDFDGVTHRTRRSAEISLAFSLRSSARSASLRLDFFNREEIRNG